MVIQGSRREYFCVLISSKSCTHCGQHLILEKSPGADPPRARLPADETLKTCRMGGKTRDITGRSHDRPVSGLTVPKLCISHAIVMTDALNIHEGTLKLKKLALQRRVA